MASGAAKGRKVRHRSTGEPAVRCATKPERTCVVCRTCRPREAMLALCERAGVVYFGRESSGRGAWVCIDRACIARLDAKGLARAFRKAVLFDGDVDVNAVVAALAERRIYELLGLARRQGVLVVGYDNVESAGAARVIIASDASPRSQDRLATFAPVVFGDSASLGRHTGLQGVQVLGIAPGSIACQAAYWLTVWYENRAHGDGRDEARN